MDVDPDRPIIYCQYCGSKELLNESEKVTVQRIKSKTTKEIELEKLKFEKEKYDREESSREQQTQMLLERERKDRQESFRKGRFKTVIIIFFALGILSTVYAISKKNILMAAISITQVIAFGTAWLKGMQFIKERHPNSYIIYAVVGLILALPLLKSCNNSGPINLEENSTFEENGTFEWPASGICTVLPEPNTNRGELDILPSSLMLELHQQSIQDYNEYIDSCREKGFTIDVKQSNIDYEAFNDEGYKLRVRYDDYSQEIDIFLNNPLEATTIVWPKTYIAGLIPAPPSNLGVIYNNSDNYFNGQLTDVSKEKWEEYVSSCENAGFTLEQRRIKNIYEAKNDDGYKIRVEYEGYNIMRFSINAPDEEAH